MFLKLAIRSSEILCLLLFSRRGYYFSSPCFSFNNIVPYTVWLDHNKNSPYSLIVDYFASTEVSSMLLCNPKHKKKKKKKPCSQPRDVKIPLLKCLGSPISSNRESKFISSRACHYLI